MTATQPHTFLFADISGYSRLTEQHGDEAAAEMAISFAAAVERLAAAHGAEFVKTSGDAVMACQGAMFSAWVAGAAVKVVTAPRPNSRLPPTAR